MGFITSKATNILQTHIKNTHYVGLSTTKPTESGGNFTEPPASAGYRKMPIGTLNTTKAAQIANDEIIFFNETLASWGTITHFGLFESASATVPYFWGELTTPVEITVTDDNTYVPIFRAEALVIGLDKAELEAYG